MGFFKCMDSMALDMRHPYIPNTTVLGDKLVTVVRAMVYRLVSHQFPCLRLYLFYKPMQTATVHYLLVVAWARRFMGVVSPGGGTRYYTLYINSTTLV